MIGDKSSHGEKSSSQKYFLIDIITVKIKVVKRPHSHTIINNSDPAALTNIFYFTVDNISQSRQENMGL